MKRTNPFCFFYLLLLFVFFLDVKAQDIVDANSQFKECVESIKSEDWILDGEGTIEERFALLSQKINEGAEYFIGYCFTSNSEEITQEEVEEEVFNRVCMSVDLFFDDRIEMLNEEYCKDIDSDIMNDCLAVVLEKEIYTIFANPFIALRENGSKSVLNYYVVSADEIKRITDAIYDKYNSSINSNALKASD